MMPLTEVVKALYGAYRLARFDTDGMHCFDISPLGFWCSFYAAVIVAPLYCLLLLVRFNIGDVETPLYRYLAIQTIAYVIAWVAFPLVMDRLVRVVDRDNCYIRYIVPYNWISVIQNAVYLPIVILGTIGALAPETSNGLAFVTLVWVLVYTWFVTRTALDVPGYVAGGLVTVDLLLSVLINAIADSMLS